MPEHISIEYAFSAKQHSNISAHESNIRQLPTSAINAINILARYHVMALMSKAIDKVRAEESKQMKADGLETLLDNSRFILLKRPENLIDKQEIKLAELMQHNLSSI